MTPHRLTLALFASSALLVLAGGGALSYQTYQTQQANTKQDTAIAALTSDANSYRAALQHQGVNPNSVAPPPSTRVEQVTGQPGSQGIPGQNGLPGQNGKDGKDGTSPPCLSTPAQCVGANGTNGTNGVDGKNGTNGTNGADGAPGRGVSSVSVTQSGDTCTMTITYTDGTTETAGTWSCPAAAPVGGTPGQTSGALIGISALMGWRRRQCVISYVGLHRADA